jgi:hypothetical protein
VGALPHNVLPDQPFDLAEFGFGFSIQQIEQHVDDVMKLVAIRQHTYFSHKEAAWPAWSTQPTRPPDLPTSYFQRMRLNPVAA